MGGVGEEVGRALLGATTFGLGEVALQVGEAASGSSGLGKGPIGTLSEAIAGKPPAPPKVPTLPKLRPIVGESPKETAERARKFLAQQAERRGRQSTILTSPLGLTETPPVGRRTLLGR